MVDCTIRRPLAFKTFWMSLSAACGKPIPFRICIDDSKTHSYLDVQTLEVGHLVREASSIVDRAWGHFLRTQHTVRNGNSVVILTEGGGLVDNTGTVFGRYVRVVEHAECLVFELSSIHQYQ